MDWSTIATILQGMTDGVGSAAILVAGIGAFSAAILEAIKGLLPVRAWFHRGAVELWTEGKHRSSDALLMGVGLAQLRRAASPQETRRELLELAIGSEQYRTALYEQAPEKMFGQIQAAANVAMDFPDRAPALYEFLAGDGTTGEGDAERWREFITQVNAGELSPNPPDADTAARRIVAAANQSRMRLDNLVRRRLDALQVRVTYQWSRGNQIFAFLIAVAITMIALDQAGVGSVLHRLLLGVLAGFVAPPAKDLAAALSNIRYK